MPPWFLQFQRNRATAPACMPISMHMLHAPPMIQHNHQITCIITTTIIHTWRRPLSSTDGSASYGQRPPQVHACVQSTLARTHSAAQRSKERHGTTRGARTYPQRTSPTPGPPSGRLAGQPAWVLQEQQARQAAALHPGTGWYCQRQKAPRVLPQAPCA